MEPILLTPYGETLVRHPGSNGYVSDESELIPIGVGQHDICGGRFDLGPVSTTHQAIICRSCGLRVRFPNSKSTYGKFREWCAKRLFKWRQKKERKTKSAEEHSPASIL